MAITNIIKSIILDVYDHDKTPKTIKSIAADNDVRYIAAEIQSEGVRYDVSASSTVELIILRPDKVGVSITGQPQEFTYETDPVFDPDTGETTPGETVTYYGVYAELDQAALAKSGILLGQFKITNGEQVLRTEIFKVNNGRALDAETSDWAGEYQGYNLDELVQTVNSVVATVEGIEIDVSGLKEDLTDANENLNNIIDSISIDLTHQYVIGYRVATGAMGDTANLNPVANGTYAYFIIDCKEGDHFVITGTGGTTYRAWAFIDANNIVVDTSVINYTDYSIIAPASAKKLVVNANTDSPYKLVKISTRIESIENAISGALNLAGLGGEIGFRNNYYIRTKDASNIASYVNAPVGSGSWRYALISCTEGDEFFINGNTGTNPEAYVFTDASYNVLLRYPWAKASETVVAPKNSAYLIINTLKTNTAKSYYGANKIEGNEKTKEYYNQNLLSVGNDNMIWSWWSYPQVVSFKRVRDKVYWGYTTSDGFIGIAEYDIETQQTKKNHLRKSSQIDDHNSPAVYVYDDGTILCSYASGHNEDYYIRVRISSVVESVERFESEILLPSTGVTSYSQLIFYDDKLYLFYRSGFNRWAYRYTGDKGATWSDEIILITSTLTNYYCKFVPTTTNGVIRVCMYSNPSLADANIRQAFLHLDTGILYDSDNATALGSSEISKDNVSILIPIDANYNTQRLLDVAVSDINRPLVLYAPFSTGSDSIYRIYDNGTIVNVITGGTPIMPSYMLGASWIGTEKLIVAYGGAGKDSVAILDYINGATVINETLQAEDRGSIPIRNARPIADINEKCVLWQRGYYGSTFTEFDMDAKLHLLQTI